jgi:hypothetical protein
MADRMTRLQTSGSPGNYDFATAAATEQPTPLASLPLITEDDDGNGEDSRTKRGLSSEFKSAAKSASLKGKSALKRGGESAPPETPPPQPQTQAQAQAQGPSIATAFSSARIDTLPPPSQATMGSQTSQDGIAIHDDAIIVPPSDGNTAGSDIYGEGSLRQDGDDVDADAPEDEAEGEAEGEVEEEQEQEGDFVEDERVEEGVAGLDQWMHVEGRQEEAYAARTSDSALQGLRRRMEAATERAVRHRTARVLRRRHSGLGGPSGVADGGRRPREVHVVSSRIAGSYLTNYSCMLRTIAKLRKGEQL